MVARRGSAVREKKTGALRGKSRGFGKYYATNRTCVHKSKVSKHGWQSMRFRARASYLRMTMSEKCASVLWMLSINHQV